MNTYQTYSKGPKAGQPKTLTDRVVRFLVEGLKKKELPYDRSNKHRRFEGSRSELHQTFPSSYWVGKAGAVRAGRSPSNSVSLTAHVHANMRMWERKEREQEKQELFSSRYGKWED
ncbi:hypothetical protein LCGC14_0458700 [marine sediment metagenome]|uniref:Uncharacterized protein n=1 Tax=marine sediment metagenome TaxID=412755 RepID=A0A0F9SYK5_9ZZZZ